MAKSRESAKRRRPSSENERKTIKQGCPITNEGDMPQKKFYRSRAHCNPLSFNETFDYPSRPDLIDWTEEHFPQHPSLYSSDSEVPSFEPSAMKIRPDVLDIGCGFGGLTISLSSILPQNTILGLEIRAKVTEYVRLRIVNQRKEHPGKYQNCSVMRTNAMKYLPNIFPKSSLKKIFFCFPDPHFKRKNHPRRIVSERLLTEYAYLLNPNGGRLYAITDVLDLHEWHVEKCRSHPLFEELTQAEMDADPCVALMRRETEEGKKVLRSGGSMYYVVYKRVDGRVRNDIHSCITAENIFEDDLFGVEPAKLLDS